MQALNIIALDYFILDEGGIFLKRFAAMIMLLCILSLSVIPGLAQSSGSTNYTNAKYGFSLQLPEDWSGKYSVEEVAVKEEWYALEGARDSIEFYYEMEDELYSIFDILVFEVSEKEWFANGYDDYWNYIATRDGHTFAYVIPNEADPNMLEPEEEPFYAAAYRMSVELTPEIITSFAFVPKKDSIAIYGKVVEINGNIADIQPIRQNNATYLPVVPALQAMGYTVELIQNVYIKASKADKSYQLTIGEKNAAVNGTKTAIDTAPAKINGATVLPVRTLANLFGAGFQYEDYSSSEINYRMTDKEKTLRDKYAAAANQLKAATAKYREASANYPQFYITGEIKDRDPFLVWGIAFGPNAPMNHPGFLIQNTNIVIKNPNSGAIMYGNYIQGVHYYHGETVGEGIFGQEVPIYIFGGPPSELGSLEKKVRSAETKLAAAKEALISYVNTYYENKVKASPTDDNYIAYALALIDTGTFLNEGKLVDLATAKVTKYVKNNQKLGYYALTVSERYLDWNSKTETYQGLAEGDPYLVLNYAKTPEQYYFAGFALSQMKNEEEKAIFALKKALKSKNATIVESAESILSKKFSIQPL